MISINPFAEFYSRCEEALKKVLSELLPRFSPPKILLEVPPNLDFGELATSVCFEVAKQIQNNPRIIAEKIAAMIDLKDLPLIKSVQAAGAGYINFKANSEEFFGLTINSTIKFDAEYGYVKTSEPKKILLEHTSVNPIHPIHIGQARNPILGDTLGRLLKERGHEVSRHYYVDDVGRQSAVIAYGYSKLGNPKPEGKPDRFIGKIYTVTSCIMEVNRLKKILEEKGNFKNQEIIDLRRELDEWILISSEIQQRFPQLFDRLQIEISKDTDPEKQVSNLIQKYESGEENTKQLLREVCELCLEGFKETLSEIEISIDSWDWESDLIWNGNVKNVINQLKVTPYVFREKEVLKFDAEKVANELDLKKQLGINKYHELSSLTLARADGTSLYTTRDIAYHLWKFERADRVVNVIGMEQTLPQLQLKLALSALGHIEYISKLTHFAYSLVRLPGYRMSSRRGRYITLDEVIDSAAKRAYSEVSKRSPSLSEQEKLQISVFVGKGAVKYALVAVDPTKPVVFTWDRVLDFEKNSAPYIQYSYARARSILRKALKKPKNVNFSLLVDTIERDLVIMIARFPEVFLDASENLRPNILADYLNSLADKFNKFYTKLPVIKADSVELSNARLALVKAFCIVIRNGLNLIGIEAPEKM